jgi:uncharacterized phage protein (TIGR01671 family)
MKREIKFRGWRRKYQCWEYGYLIECPAPELNEIVEVTKSGGRIIAAVERDSIGQYTGLHDKNGREIYEGDLLRCASYTYGNKETDKTSLLVKYHEMSAGFIAGPYMLGKLMDIGKCEVIGNIYENPDLLEAQHD